MSTAAEISRVQIERSFAGTLRRFERKGEANGVLVYDDYGHHPTEVKAPHLSAAKEFLHAARFVVVFQPHRYSRTQALWREFGTAFEAADKIIITQLYSAHETANCRRFGAFGLTMRCAKTMRASPFFTPRDLDEALGLALENVGPGDALVDDGRGRCDDVGAACFGGD